MVSTGQLVRMSPIYQVTPGPGRDAADLQPARRVRTGVRRQPDPEPVRLHDRRLRPGPLRPAQDVRHPTEQPCRTVRPSWPPRSTRNPSSLEPDLPVEPERLVGAARATCCMIPVANSLLYVQPLYVESSRNPFPELQRVIAVYGNQPAAIGNTLSAALVRPVHGAGPDSPPRRRRAPRHVVPAGRGTPGPGPGLVHAVAGRPEGRQPRAPTRTTSMPSKRASRKSRR